MKTLKVSIIIPSFNEDHTLSKVIDNILDVEFPIEKEIIVVDDGSLIPQNTFIQDKIENGTIKFKRLIKNQGKGAAIRAGLKYTSGNIFIVQDADFEYHPKDILTLLEPIIKGKAKVVYGSRLKSEEVEMSKSHHFGNKILTRITNSLYKSKLTDMETGYKVFLREVLEKINLTAQEFEFEPDITSKILLKGYKIIEIPISYHYRKYAETKITVFDGIESLIVLIQNRFFQDSKIFRFFYRIYKYHLKKLLVKITFKFKRYKY